ncbi:MAG: hypothetical protein DWQ02_01365 [Bacteroidetes bacterium]|nr:MAG: hypothetical protein DWQ02_01365 [Bacteroidota bacterium]
MKNQETEFFHSLDKNFFICDNCKQTCECTFTSGSKKYCMEADINHENQTVNLKLYCLFNGNHKNIIYQNILPMQGSRIPIPPDFTPGTNPSKHCSCK